MLGTSPSEVVTLLLRVTFLLLLYGLVAAVLLALRRDLLRTAGGRGDAARPSERARLTLVEAAPVDGPTGRTVPLAGALTIGRRPPSDVLLRDDSVSGVHAHIVRRDGAWVVEDAGSTNGTYLNGRRVDGPAALQPGDVVTTGVAVWRFEVDTP